MQSPFEVREPGRGLKLFFVQGQGVDDVLKNVAVVRPRVHCREEGGHVVNVHEHVQVQQLLQSSVCALSVAINPLQGLVCFLGHVLVVPA